MAGESLFGRGQDEAEGRQARIDRLFSEAVERQVVEQRSFSRVMEDVGERLASLESGLRSLWETTSSQGLALRGELQDGLANVAEDVDTRARALTEGVERLRASSADHAARLGELASASEQAIEALGESQGRLAEKFVVLEQSVAASTEQTANIPDLVAPQLHRLEEIVAQAEGHVRHALDSGIRELDERVAKLDSGLGRRLADVAGRLDERLEMFSQRLGAIEQRVDSQGEAVEQTTSDIAKQVAEALEASDQRRAEDSADYAQVLRGALSERIHAVEARLDERFSSLGVVIDERLAEVANDLSSRLSQALVALGEATLRDAAETRDAAATAVEHLGEVSARLTRIEEHLSNVLEAPGRTAAAIMDVFKPFLEDFRSTLLAEQRHELAGSLGQVQRVASGVANEIEELQILATALRQAHSEDEGRMLALRDDVLAAVEGLLRKGLGDIRQTVDEWVSTAQNEGRVLRSMVEERFDVALATLKRLGERVGTVDERLPEVLSGHREDLIDTLERFEVAMAERLRASEEEGRALLQTLEERLRTSEQEGRALRFEVEKRVYKAVSALEGLTQIRVVLEQRLSEVLHTHERQVAATLRAALGEASKRLDAADDVLRTAVGKLDDLAPGLDTRIARALDRAVETARREARSSVEELHSAVAQLAEMQATFSGLEGSLVAYLGAFDARLERERAHIVSKLGEELAEGLSRRERKRLVGRLRVPQETGDSRPPEPEDVGATPSSAPWRVSAREVVTRREVGSPVSGTAAKPPGGVSETAAKPPGGRGVSETAAKPPGGRGAPWSSALPIPQEPKPAPGMRPGLLTELLGEEPGEAMPEPATQKMLGVGGAEDTAEAERKEKPLPGQEPDAGDAKPTSRAATEGRSGFFVCPTCDFIARSGAGLASHRRRHA